MASTLALIQTPKGNNVSLCQLARDIVEHKKIVYFGEIHSVPKIVNLQLAVLEAMTDAAKTQSAKVHIFLEHFSIDDQTLLDSFIKNNIQSEKEFIQKLLKQTVSLDANSEKLIEELADNWELDRIAKMDVLLLKMAFAELQSFESIPTKVTINEYLEISKYYSTPKSNVFINGILDKSLKKLTAENKIIKKGRGLKQ